MKAGPETGTAADAAARVKAAGPPDGMGRALVSETLAAGGVLERTPAHRQADGHPRVRVRLHGVTATGLSLPDAALAWVMRAENPAEFAGSSSRKAERNGSMSETNMYVLKGARRDREGTPRYTGIGVMWRNMSQDGETYFRIQLDYIPSDLAATEILAFPPKPRDGDA